MTHSLPVSRNARRIAVVSHVHPSIQRGGAELSAYAVFQGLCALGEDAIFIAAVPEQRRGELALASMREFAIFYDPTAYDHFYQLGPGSLGAQLATLLTETGCTLVNFHHFMNFGVNAIRSVASLPVRTIVTLHEYLAICHNHGQMITTQNRVLCEAASLEACGACFPDISRQRFALRYQNFQQAFTGVDGFVSPSRFLSRRFIDWGLPADKITVIENGLLHVPGLAPSRRRRTGDDSWVFGYFGQITPFKGLATLLDAADLIARDPALAARIKINVHGNMVGQGQAFLDRFEKAVSDYPFLTYGGAYSNRDVARLMAECDYVVVPSIWWENSPVVIQEAYAIGRPVICTGIGGMAEKVVDGTTGLHFRVRDHVDLLKLFEYASDPALYESLRAQLPEVTGATQMAQSYIAFFDRLALSSVPVVAPPPPPVRDAAPGRTSSSRRRSR